MTHDMLHVMEWHNGAKGPSPFSQAEMARRHGGVRDWMARVDADAVMFTSAQSITYFSGWSQRAFGRRYGMVLTRTEATTISAGVDGGRGWRQSHGGNVTYTDWRRDNFFRALRQLTAGVKRLAIEFDHVSLDFRRLLDAALPGVGMVDISDHAAGMRMVKSSEELSLIRKGAEICEAGMVAGAGRIAAGVPEYDVAAAANAAMTCAVAQAFPQVEPMEGWTWFQSGINTDGAHNPVTSRRVARGDILSLSCVPVLFGYATPVGRTLFCGEADDASLAIWEKNLTVHRRALELVRPGARCNEIAAELNDLYRGFGLLKHRSASYGHAVGVSGRAAGPDLREDVVTELRPGMVLSVGPSVMLPQGMPGAGGYRDHDMLVVTGNGSDRLTGYPLGPEHNIVG